MASVEERLTQWLRDAHAMETHAEKMLKRQAEQLDQYPETKARVEQHIEETRGQAGQIEACLERRGESISALKEWGAKGAASGQSLMKGMASDDVVKSGIASYAFEHFEMACYKTLIVAAEQIGDHETQSTCEEILRQEEAMAKWLEDHLPATTRTWLQGDERSAA